MRSTFTGFNIARSGLFASQRALDITGHNISNVNTPGYTRQRLEQTSSTPLRLPGGQGMLGTGVDTTAVKQIRNEFLDYKYRDESTSLGFWETRADGLAFIEDIMNEPSDTGINQVINEMFESFQELSKNPDNLTTRSLVRQRAITFTNSINHTYNQLEKMAEDYNFDIQTTVNQINTKGEQIARLNDQIFRAEATGNNANDLRDKRNLLIDELSEIVDIEVQEINNPDNPKHPKTVIKVAGRPLVYHDEFVVLKTEKLTYSGDPNDSSNHPIHNEKGEGHPEFYKIVWEDDIEFQEDALKGGQLKGLLEMRDGDGKSGSPKGIPYYIKELNKFVNTFANEINKIHLEGYGLNGNTNMAFFTVDGNKTPENVKIEYDDDGNLKRDENGDIIINNDEDNLLKGINAANIRISEEIEDPNNIAASDHPDRLPKDGSKMLEITELRHKQSMFNEGKPEDFIKSLIGNLGVDAEEANRNTLNQHILVDSVDNRRISISGVSQDEELSNMVRFQHAYNASARMMTTMDEMLDVLINRVGLVGR